MPWYAYLLAPAAFLFHGITAARNFLFDRGLLKSQKAPFPTLVVGNLSVGGTGKTPWVAFLAELLGQERLLGTLSRGYGRKTKGFFQLQSSSTAAEVGDEPLQLYTYFKGEIPVFVGEDRLGAAQKIHHLFPDLQLLILDDAFQHRKLAPDFRILLTSFYSPLSKDHLLPMGRLRESRAGAKRAEIVVVTKCPAEMSSIEKSTFRQNLSPFLAPGADLFFSSINYGLPYQVVGPLQPLFSKVIALSGLADNRLFLDYCQQHFEVLATFPFPDHYSYADSDAVRIVNLLAQEKENEVVLLTTEKDAVKFKSLAATGIWSKIPIFALPIKVALEPSQQKLLLHRLRQTLFHP
ncbi:MAG: tetraacyldisaccharide 4'-kinase [Bacteroidetes bacterium]|nr:tetraacyldisaccharide 4'-kinase [Bacteroidota bacterium]MDA1268311.1 tetraacyldisaccharide 4'-kinase [Bacteroidota bacterium]